MFKKKLGGGTKLKLCSVFHYNLLCVDCQQQIPLCIQSGALQDVMGSENFLKAFYFYF